MYKKKLLYISICFCFMASLIIYPSVASDGVKYGLSLCATVIIPSLFPFTVLALIVFKLNVPFLNKSTAIMLLSHLGGYPVGAKLVDAAYKENEIDKKTGELMLGYCVNSGPAFILIVIGSGIWNSKMIGMILFASSLLSSLSIMLMNIKSLGKTKKHQREESKHQLFSEIFIESTYDATESMLKICGSVVLFSTLIYLITPLLQNIIYSDYMLSLLEISNGVILAQKNIYLTAFLIGFGGLSVHFQVMSICQNLKPNYVRFLFFRFLHGALCAVIASFLLKIFKISSSVLSTQGDFRFELTKYSIVFSVMLMICCILFMISVKKPNNLW